MCSVNKLLSRVNKSLKTLEKMHFFVHQSLEKFWPPIICIQTREGVLYDKFFFVFLTLETRAFLPILGILSPLFAFARAQFRLAQLHCPWHNSHWSGIMIFSWRFWRNFWELTFAMENQSFCSLYDLSFYGFHSPQYALKQKCTKSQHISRDHLINFAN